MNKILYNIKEALPTDAESIAQAEEAVFADPWSSSGIAHFSACDSAFVLCAKNEAGRLCGYAIGSFAAGEGETYEGLILLASYSTADLTQGDLRVLSVYGDRDGVLNREKYEQYRENLPESTVELVLEGANHAGFGAYGPQEGDGEAAISRQEQQEKTVEAICGFLLAQFAPAD